MESRRYSEAGDDGEGSRRGSGRTVGGRVGAEAHVERGVRRVGVEGGVHDGDLAEIGGGASLVGVTDHGLAHITEQETAVDGVGRGRRDIQTGGVHIGNRIHNAVAQGEQVGPQQVAGGADVVSGVGAVGLADDEVTGGVALGAKDGRHNICILITD